MAIAMSHIGISVANLERSIAFYRDVFEMELMERENFGGALYERILALSGTSGKVALLQRGSIQIELFEFVQPSPKKASPSRPVCDHGITHFCIEVDDIEILYNHMKMAGVHFHCPPLEFPGAVKATYGRDPDGNVFELLEISRK